MGRDFRNEFSWSVTRAKLFEFCLRKYYWNYYGYWDGWNPEAPETARLAYRLKKISSLPLWTGDIVHRAVAEALKRISRYQHADAKRMKAWARDTLNREWFQSRDEKWRENAKHNLNLMEHYYQRPITTERREQLRDTVFRCLDNFFEGDYFREANELGVGRWKTVEELKTFQLDDLTVFVQLDFAFERGDDGLVIVDWKSGKFTPEKDAEQLSCYALFAVQEWRIPPERIHLAGVYLNENRAKEWVADPTALIALREKIYQSAAQMRERLDDPAENAASLGAFPQTEDEWKCADCPFLELCDNRK